MATMRVAQVSGPKRPFEIVERPVPQPGPGTVRIKVAACGICHSDALVKEGLWPGIQYPRVPGHEVAGAIDAVTSASGSDGMADIAGDATTAGAGICSRAKRSR